MTADAITVSRTDWVTVIALAVVVVFGLCVMSYNLGSAPCEERVVARTDTPSDGVCAGTQ